MNRSLLTPYRSTSLAAALAALVSVALLGSAANGATIFDDAVVYYDMEGSGQTVADQSGTTAIDLTLGADSASAADDPLRVAGRIGSGGLSFDGDDVASNGGDNNRLDFNGGDSFTVAGWFNRDNADSSMLLATKMDTSGSTFPGWIAMWRGSEETVSPEGLELTLRDDAGNTGDGRLTVRSDPVSDAGWVHLAITYNGSGNADGVNFFANGQLVNTDTSTDNGFGAGTSTDNTAPFNIGGRDDGGSFVGDADEVAVWDRVLSQSEVQQAMIPEPATAAGFALVFGALSIRRRRR